MKLQIKHIVLGLGALMLVGCGSMHPPTINPYFPGYHARDANEVEDEYQAWEQEQARLEERARIQDSLQAEYDELYREWIADGNFNFQQYNFYRDRYPYWGHRNRYYYPRSGWNFSFRYSNQPWFVDSWWADDYLWDQYFWGSRWSNNYYYHNTYDPFYNPYFFNSYYTSYGYYDPYYGYGHYRYPRYYYVVDDNATPSQPRPANRDIFSRGGGSGSATSSIDNSNTFRPINPESPGTRSITPAVIDREKTKSSIPLRRPVNRGQIRIPTKDSDDNNRSVHKARPAYDTSTSSRSSSSTSTTSVRRKSSSSSGGSKSSSSSGNNSENSKKRPKDRRH